jgi:hypothetical protein
VIWKWRDIHKRHLLFNYSADAVNKLAVAISNNLSLPHDIVCITDDAAFLRSDIRPIRLWSDARNLRGCWTRLKAFSPEMREIIGPRFVWVDLDALVTASLDPLFARTEEIVLLRAHSILGMPHNGSMVMMNAGARPQVWQSFDPSLSKGLIREHGLIGTDQAWITYTLGTSEATWGTEDGVMLFRTDCVPDVPAHSRLVFFAGTYKPHMKSSRALAPWIARFVSR